MAKEKNSGKKESSSGRLLMLIVVSLVILCGAVYYVMLKRGDTYKDKNSEPLKSSSSPVVYEATGFEKGETAVDPVSKEPVNTETAPYMYVYEGKTFYFKSEENLSAFIDDPVKYSGIPMRTREPRQPSPSPTFITPPVDIIPDNTDIPVTETPFYEPTPEVTETETPDIIDTPQEKPGEVKETPFNNEGTDVKETPFGTWPDDNKATPDSKDNGVISTPKENTGNTPIIKETPFTPASPTTKPGMELPPPQEITSTPPASSPLPLIMTSPTPPVVSPVPPSLPSSSPSPSPTEVLSPSPSPSPSPSGKPKYEIPPGAFRKRPTATPTSKPTGKPKDEETPVEPPKEGVETL